MVKISTQGTDPDRKGGMYLDQEGDFHFSIEGARDKSSDSNPTVEFDLVVEGSANSDCIHRKMTETFYLSGATPEKTTAALNRLTKFLCAIGLYNETQWKADRESGVEFDFDVESAIGRQLCARVRLKDGKKPGQKFANLGYDLWAVGDSEADAIPKGKEWIEAIEHGGKLPTRAGGWRVPGSGVPAGNKPAPLATTPARTPPRTPPRAAVPAPAKVASVASDDIPF